ncbi:hypothetical protein TWF730_007561 [Orbilia blumenaviensis]|uniref:EGF domain-specific O-linked N-acetylglucosamine transferase n=1 Tax=Orbilia blumenaviensis TaxID=1796055 RepID=A0AAV9VEL5_9PEZI
MILNLNKRLLSTLTIFILALLLLLINHAFHRSSSSAPTSYNYNRTPSTQGSNGSKGKIISSGPGVGGSDDDNNDDNNNNEDDEDEDDWCSRVAGQRYLNDLSTTWTVSCSQKNSKNNKKGKGKGGDGGGGARLVCFQTQVEEEPDNLCVARNAVYSATPGLKKPITKEDLFPEKGIRVYTGDGNTGGGGTVDEGEVEGKRNTRPGRGYKKRHLTDNDEEGTSPPQHYNTLTRRQFSKKWSLNCSPNTEWAYGVQAPFKFRSYFVETGAGQQLNGFDMRVKDDGGGERDCKGSIMLVKLEGGGNIWHTLMEVWSAVLTLDALEKAGDAREALFGPSSSSLFHSSSSAAGGGISTDKIWEEENIQIYIQKNLESEKKASPVFGLWNVVTGKDVKDIKELPDGCYKSVILPLAGGANPFWKDHWKERKCKGSVLVDRFVNKVMAFYGVEDTPSSSSSSSSSPESSIIKIRIITRQHNRKILRLFDYIKLLQSIYPPTVASIEVLKLESLHVTEQLRLMQSIDVLIGVTGAGLTHTMFLKKGAAVVELTHPEPFIYYGFSNTARMRGVEHFAVHGEKAEGKSGINWQEDNVSVDEKTFLEVVGRAVEGQKARKKMSVQ